MRAIRVLPRAKGHLSSARKWYEDQEPGLGERFLQAVSERLAMIADHPEAFPLYGGRTRRAPVAVFPYLVFYLVRERTIDVIAVLHEKRKPRRWR